MAEIYECESTTEEENYRWSGWYFRVGLGREDHAGMMTDT